MNLMSAANLQDTIEEKERRFQAYMENTREAVWKIDLQPMLPLNASKEQMVKSIFHHTIITEANDAMARMYGKTEGREIIGQPLSNFMLSSDRENVRAVNQLVREKFCVQDVVTHERKLDGTTGIFLNSTTPRFKGGCLKHFWGSSLEITELCAIHENLKEANSKLEEKNIALKELIAQVNIDRENWKDQIMENVEHVLLPALEKITITNGDNRYIKQFRNDLADLTSSFGRTLVNGREKLTPREIEVCRLVKNGLTNKEIAKFLCISLHTVEKHRRIVRKKLGINNMRVNLQTYLASNFRD